MNLPQVSPQVFRLLDANLNRLGEGLRLLEDIARFALNSPQLSQRFKELRHHAGQISSRLGVALLSARDSRGDVGARSEEGIEAKRDNLLSLARANARRAQESLRVIEELAGLPELSSTLSRTQLQEMRFALYTLEKELGLSLLRSNRRNMVRGLYVIVDLDFLRGRDSTEVARQAIRGGASMLQLRGKGRDKGEMLARAEGMKSACSELGCLFIVNDHVDLALAVQADGVHVGQGDLPVGVVRRHLPLDRIVGCSTTTPSLALKAEAEGADYIAVGSIYPTSSKATATVVGLETLRAVREAVSLPVVAIGGIKGENIPSVLEAGADSVAVISAVMEADDIAAAARTLATIIEGEKTKR